MAKEEQLTDWVEVMEALAAAIKAAPKVERDTLATAMRAYQRDFPDEFFWAVGVQSPTLLYHLIISIDMAANDDDGQGRTRVIRLITDKPEGNA